MNRITLLFILVLLHSSAGEDVDSVGHLEDANVTGVHADGESLDWLQGMLQDLLRLSKLPAKGEDKLVVEVLQLNQVIDNTKSTSEANKLEMKQLKAKIKMLEAEIGSKDITIQTLEENLEDCRQEVQNGSYNEVQDLSRKITEGQRREVQLQEMLEHNKNTMEELNCTTTDPCEEHQKHPEQNRIKQLVEKFSGDGDWDGMRKGLEAVLDPETAAYQQLQKVFSDRWHMTPEWQTSTYGYTELATLLVCAGIPANRVDSSGDTMLHGASWGDEMFLIKLLVGRGANLDLRNAIGRTPLMNAVVAKHMDVTRWLVGAGSNTSIKDNEGYTAHELSVQYLIPEAAEYLSQFPH